MRLWPVVFLLLALSTLASARWAAAEEPQRREVESYEFADFSIQVSNDSRDVVAVCEWRGDTTWVREEARATIRGSDAQGLLEAERNAVDYAFKQLLSKVGIPDPRRETSDGYFAWATRDTPVLSVFGRRGWLLHGEEVEDVRGPSARTRAFRFCRRR